MSTDSIFPLSIDTKNFRIGIKKDHSEGFFEHMRIPEKITGSMWFDNDDLIDIDVPNHLPDEVSKGLIENGFTVDSVFCRV